MFGFFVINWPFYLCGCFCSTLFLFFNLRKAFGNISWKTSQKNSQFDIELLCTQYEVSLKIRLINFIQRIFFISLIFVYKIFSHKFAFFRKICLGLLSHLCQFIGEKINLHFYWKKYSYFKKINSVVLSLLGFLIENWLWEGRENFYV